MTKNLKIIRLQNAIILLILIFSSAACATNYPDVNRFYDSAHHWYDIHDDDRMIEPIKNQERYDRNQVSQIADNIVLFQKYNGGWAKNYDMRAILTPEQKARVSDGKNRTNTTFDNGATHTQLSYLAEAYTISKKEEYIDAFLKGMDFVLSAQYDNGGFPQFYPDTSNYRKHITFNDGAMIGIMNLLLNIVNRNESYTFIPEEYYSRIDAAYANGIDCILKSQIEEDGIKTAWCQQHDHITLEPQGARTFEPAAICNGESSGIVEFLMRIKNPTPDIKLAVTSAVKWFESSALTGFRTEFVEAPKEEYIYHTSTRDRIIVEDPDAPRIWARFYELGTHVPLFCRRDGKIVYSMEEVERERREGYGWYHYAPERVLEIFPEWLKKTNIK
ncbi:MAG: pectate lyase [Melioribacteraceae bacterium]|nr:MAG: pectate lyase [Melioribacteraceae bacterium]